MKNNPILDLFYNDIRNKKIKQSDQFYKIYKKFNALCNAYEHNLDKIQKDKFNEIIDANAELTAESEETAYVSGFKTGMIIAIGALLDK